MLYPFIRIPWAGELFFLQEMTVAACIKFNVRLKCSNVVQSLEAVCVILVWMRILAGFGAVLHVIKNVKLQVRIY